MTHKKIVKKFILTKKATTAKIDGINSEKDFMKINVRKVFAWFFVALLVFMPLLAGGSNEVVPAVTVDKAGNHVTLPKSIEKIAVFAPSTLKVIDGLGLRDKLIAIDTYSQKTVEGVKDLPAFDMMKPECEKIIALKPDLVFMSGMSNVAGADPFKPVRDAGICVLNIPSSNSIKLSMMIVSSLRMYLEFKKKA